MRTHAVDVEAGTKQVTTCAEAKAGRKGTKMKPKGKVKAHMQGKVKMIAVGQEKAAGSARDSTEPGGVASLGHPQWQVVTMVLF